MTMKGRTLAWALLAVLAAALVGQTVRWRSDLAASRQLRQVETLGKTAAGRGRASLGLLVGGLETLRKAERLDPVEVAIPMARGDLQLLFRNYQAALEAYREAEALEPRPEVYLHLGHASSRLGRRDEAQRYYRLARRLDPTLAPSVPPDYQ